MMKYIKLLFVLFASPLFVVAQTNTAISSGSIAKCGVWNYPYTLYNNAGATQTISNTVTVTVDQNKITGAVVLSGTGALAMSGSNGITFSGSGGDMNCRWDINKNENYTMVNNDGNSDITIDRMLGSFFTAPYNGNYIWTRGSGWNAAYSTSTIYNAVINFYKNTTGLVSIFSQRESGSCSISSSSSSPASWISNKTIALNSGDTLQYAIGTGYSSSSSCSLTFNPTIGNAQIILDN